MAEWSVDAQAVAIASTLLFDRQVARHGEFHHDSLDHALSNPDQLGDVAKSYLGVPINAPQHVRVISQKGPGRLAWRLSRGKRVPNSRTFFHALLLPRATLADIKYAK